jgi:hypothetical protein
MSSPKQFYYGFIAIFSTILLFSFICYISLDCFKVLNRTDDYKYDCILYNNNSLTYKIKCKKKYYEYNINNSYILNYFNNTYNGTTKTLVYCTNDKKLYIPGDESHTSCIKYSTICSITIILMVIIAIINLLFILMVALC